jgi:hypothetical protein
MHSISKKKKKIVQVSKTIFPNLHSNKTSEEEVLTFQIKVKSKLGKLSILYSLTFQRGSYFEISQENQQYGMEGVYILVIYSRKLLFAKAFGIFA